MSLVQIATPAAAKSIAAASKSIYVDIVEQVEPTLFKGTILEACPFDLYRHSGFGSSIELYYDPFKIIVPIWMPTHEKLLRAFSHDTMHALHFFLSGQSKRLLMPEFGLGRPSKDWSYKAWLNEVTVVAMQVTALTEHNDCEEYYTNICLDVASRVNKPSKQLIANKQLDIHNEVVCKKHIKLTINYWKNKLDFLATSFNNMVIFCNNNRRK